MNLCVAYVCQDVGVYFPFHGEFFHLVAKPVVDGAIVALRLTKSLWVVRRSEDVLNPHDLANTLKKT